ncbi:MAG TPA: MmcQ/YjbR family DNA-binding protein [Candidatus Eisenbacteria bacterium]
MTPAMFRKLALSFPDAVESSHQAHPDFRAHGKVFASLGYPDAGHGSLKLTPAQQEAEMAQHPDVFSPAAGAWGRRGYTVVALKPATVTLLRRAMAAARANVEPKKSR